MTTPIDGEWMSASEALKSLSSMNYVDAVNTICTRAHAGLIQARAKLFIKNGKRQSDAGVPPEFWWAGIGKDLTQNWDVGDFKTWFDYGDTQLQAFGVMFRRSDIEQLKPPTTTANSTAPPSAHRPAGRTVFIGHGRSEEWRKFYMFLQDDHSLNVREFNSGSSPAGISITDHLQSMLDQADFAFLILTGDDLQATGELNPRLNVVHEAGLFQGRLGFQKAILFLEEGCQGFSNLHGVTHIPFSKGKIETQFHQATKALKREELI
jgi:predicted nucleotide-binding protein